MACLRCKRDGGRTGRPAELLGGRPGRVVVRAERQQPNDGIAPQRLPVRVAALACAVATLSAAGCQVACSATSCDGTALIVPVVTVADATTGTPICDASVVVIAGGASSQPLQGLAATDAGATATCSYRWDVDHYAGTFTLQVTKPGYQTEVVNDVRVQSASCAGGGSVPQPQIVKVSLTHM
jgi:hypothetical protein